MPDADRSSGAGGPPGPVLPFEFTVAGRPVSHQTNNRKLLAGWQQHVRAAAAARWGPAGPVATPVKLVVTYYHDGPAARIDGDNLLKAIQDALIGLVYDDDSRVTDTATRKTSIDAPIRPRGASRVLLSAYADGDEFVHVIVDQAPSHDEPLR